MTSFQFKKAIRENVSVILGICGGTGSGKTMTAMRIAAGICGDKRFVVLDTENGRAKYYADKFDFDVGEIHEPFTPEKYTEAILAADAAGYPVIVVDSMSHVYAGSGGILDQQEAELTRMAGDDFKRREACKMASWVKCKMAHKKMVQRLLQVKAHLILCFRAEEKIEMVKDSDGKFKIQPKTSPTGLNGWVVIAEKNLPYELTASILLIADQPGVPHPIKLMADYRPMFPLDKPIDEESGKRVAEWAAGGQATTISETDLDAMCVSMDVKTVPALKTAFQAAYRKAKDARDERAMKKLKATYDSQLDALSTGAI